MALVRYAGFDSKDFLCPQTKMKNQDVLGKCRVFWTTCIECGHIVLVLGTEGTSTLYRRPNITTWAPHDRSCEMT